jgi:hypothetical protein
MAVQQQREAPPRSVPSLRAGVVDEKLVLFSLSAAQLDAPRSFDFPENYGHVSWAEPNMLI